MVGNPLRRPPVSPELFEGELYETPALARQSIEDYDFGLMALPFISPVRRKRHRAAAKAAMAALPRRFELPPNTDRLTGKTGRASVYISRKVANETQPVAQAIRTVLTPATQEGTYRLFGLGGWHVTIAKAQVDMGGMSPDEFKDSIGCRLEKHAERLLMPIGGVAMVGAKVCGNQNGGHGSSRFIGLTPHHGAELLEEMRGVRLLLDPMVNVGKPDWFHTPHISVARAESKLFDLPQNERQRLESTICAAIEEQTTQLRPLTLTAACVELSDC